MQPCHNFCSTLATSALALTSLPGLNPPKTWFRGLARPTQVREGERRCRQTSPKPAEDLPRRTWPRSEDQEDLDRRRIVSGSQVEPCRPQRRQWPCIYPSPRGLLRLLSHARGPCTFLHDFFAKKRAHGSVQPMLRFVINTPARLQLFSLPTGALPAGSCTPAAPPPTGLPTPSRERLGRDVGGESILAFRITFQITFPLNISHFLCVTFAGRAASKSVLPWTQSTPALQCADSNWIAKIAETDPRETLGSPQGATVGGHFDRSLALR